MSKNPHNHWVTRPSPVTQCQLRKAIVDLLGDFHVPFCVMRCFFKFM